MFLVKLSVLAVRVHVAIREVIEPLSVVQSHGHRECKATVHTLLSHGRVRWEVG